MHRWSMALCLSASLVALSLAGYVVLEDRSDGSESREMLAGELREMRTLLASLEEKIGEIESRHDALARRTPQREPRKPGMKSRDGSSDDAEGAATAPSGGLEAQVATLTERLASLENEETIARLAQSGRVQVEEKEIRTAIDVIQNPDADPDDKLEAAKKLRAGFWKNGKMVGRIMGESELTERDVVMPMLDLAQDRTLEAEFRAEVIRNFHGSRLDDLRQPMLDILALDSSPEVRGEALTTLMWRMDDPEIRNVIRQTSQEDRHEEVRTRAQRVLPKLEHLERQEAARAAGEAGQEK